MYVVFSLMVTIIFIIYMSYFSKYMNYILIILGYTSYLYYIITYTTTFLINPGYPQKYLSEEIKLNTNLRYCNHCKIYYEPNKKVVHCYDCNICVEGYDHHCPWTGKCIGKGNITYFYLFLSSVFIIFFYFTFSFVFIADAMQKK